MDKPSHWVMAGFVHILPKIGLKQPSIFQSVYILYTSVYIVQTAYIFVLCSSCYC